jgi:hypothetical protein
MPDLYGSYLSGLDSPALGAASVTPSDSTDLSTWARSLYVGGAGNINVVTVNGSTVLFSSVPAGFILPVRVKRVLSTSTTATNIVALY